MLRGALIGTGVALLCFLPPLLHFVLGPLSPFIGGFVGGSQAARRAENPSPLTPLGVGLLIGLFMAVAAAVVGVPVFLIVRSFFSDSAEGGGIGLLALFIPLGFGVYAAVLGMGGAFLGAALRGRPSTIETRD